ncbi:MAG: hypothetical protein SGBAC_006104 [Bacillariaceae sp.]
MVSNKDFADGRGIDIHIRTKIVRFWSFIENAVIRIGNDILEIAGSSEKGKARHWINYEGMGELETVGGFPVTINPGKNKYTIDLGSLYPGEKIEIKTFKEFVGVKIVGASESSFGNSAGITGDFLTGNTYARDGSTVLNDFTELGNEWQVLPSDGRLFHELARPQFPEKCWLPEDPRGARRRRLAESNITEDQAETACAGLEDDFSRKGCVYDILATQDLDMYYYILGKRIVPSQIEDEEVAVVITGCDSGFGKEIAFRLAAEGFHVFAGILNPSSKDLFLGEPLIQPIVLDVTKEKDVQNSYEVVSKWIKEGGGNKNKKKQRCLHALVNNAGLGRFGLIDWNTMDDYEICMNVNCYGPIRMVKAFLPLFKQQAIQGSYKKSQIVNMISCAGLASAGGLGATPYEVSKNAAEAFTDCLRLEMKTFGIKVVSVNPSFHSTELVDSTNELLDPETFWNTLSKTHQEEYGKTFVEKLCTHAQTMIRSSTWNFKVVVDSMVEIVQSSSPPAQVVVGMDFKYGLAGIRMLPQWCRHCLTLIPLPYLEPAAMAAASKQLPPLETKME